MMLTGVMSCLNILNVWAAAGPICAQLIGDNANANDAAYVKWETQSNGDVKVTVFKDGDANCSWRDRGLADDVTKAKGWELIINNEPVSDISAYFTKSYTTGSTVYTLALKPNVTVPAGSVITLSPKKNVCWRTTSNTNAYKYNGVTNLFEYVYGETCQGLEPPTNISISNTNVITFDAVDGASGYKICYYYGNFKLLTETITNGATLVRPLRKGGTYQIKLITVDDKNAESEESEPVNWVLEDQTIAPADLGSSVFCSSAIGSGNSLAYQTWETDANGNVVISIAGDGAAWRGTAFKGVQNFMVGRVPGNVLFTENYTQGTATYTMQLKSGAPMVTGEGIVFHGDMQWKTTLDNNAYALNQTLDTYVYGSTCSSLGKPEITTISDAKVISASNADNADQFLVNISYAGTPLATEVVAKGAALTFKPLFENATYQVSIISQAQGLTDSEESDPFDWTPTKEDLNLPNSEYCGYSLVSAEGSAQQTQAYLTAQTSGNDIVLSLEGNAVHNAQYRADGFTLAGFKLNGISASEWFTGAVNGNEYTLSLKAGLTMPLGYILTYNGSIAWQTSDYGNCYLLNQALSYTIGAVCGSLDVPTIDNITDGVMNLDADISGAESYIVNVRLNNVLMYTTTIANGAAIGFVPRVTGDYKVTASAHSSTRIDSDPSAEYTWPLNAVAYTPGVSTVCNANIKTGVATVSMNTKHTDHSVIIEIAGGDDVFFRGTNAMDLSNFMVGPAPANNFFTMEATAKAKEIVLHPIPSADLAYGMTITYTGSVYYMTDEAPNAYELAKSYTYTYGDQCEGWGGDTEKPVMVSATTVDYTAYNAIIAVSATDNDEVVRYVLTGDIDSVMKPINGTLILSDLTPNTEYTIQVAAKDKSDNISDNTIQVQFTTTVAQSSANGVGTMQMQFANIYALVNNKPLGSLTEANVLNYYIVDCGQQLLFKVRLQTGQINNNNYSAQLRTWNDAQTNVAENWASNLEENRAVAWERINQNPNHQYLWNGTHTNVPMSFYLASNLGGTSSPNMFTYKRGYINNPNQDAEIPTLASASIDGTGDTWVITFGAATDNSGEWFYLVEDENSNYRKVALEDTIHIAKANDGTHHIINCYAVDFNGNKSIAKTVEYTNSFDGDVYVSYLKTTEAGSTQGNFTSDRAVDGVETGDSRWGNYGQVSGDNSWWLVDLEAEYYINRIAIVWQHFPEGGVTIEGSFDKIDWTTIATADAQATAESIDFDPEVAARYVRIRATAYMSFYEFKVYALKVIQNVKLSDLQVNGVAIADFSPWREEYDFTYPFSVEVPYVSYTAADPVNVETSECWYPTANGGLDYVITITSTIDPTESREYIIHFLPIVEIGNEDNSAVLAAADGHTVAVNFTRPIDATNGDWYTLCLPFNMSAEQIEAAFGPCQLAILATSEWLSEYNLARIRHTHVSAIEAGVPYLFLPENSISGDVTIPGVTIDNTLRPVNTAYVDYVGTFNPIALADDGYTFYLDDNNMLYHPWENMTLRATRCYYHFHNLTPAQMQNIMARVMIDGDANHTPTTVEQITVDPTINGKYILNGQLIIIRDGVEYNAQGQIIK